MTQTPEPTPDDDPRSFWNSPVSLETLKPAMYEVGGGVAPEDLDGIYVSEITDACAEEAWRVVRDVRAGMRAEIAALLRSVSAGRQEYLASYAKNEQNPHLTRMRDALAAEAQMFELAAKIAEGDDSPLYGLLPSWRWTDEMTAALYAKDGDRD